MLRSLLKPPLHCTLITLISKLVKDFEFFSGFQSSQRNLNFTYMNYIEQSEDPFDHSVV